MIDFRSTYGVDTYKLSDSTIQQRHQLYLTLKQLNNRSRGC